MSKKKEPKDAQREYLERCHTARNLILDCITLNKIGYDVILAVLSGLTTDIAMAMPTESQRALVEAMFEEMQRKSKDYDKAVPKP